MTKFPTPYISADEVFDLRPYMVSDRNDIRGGSRIGNTWRDIGITSGLVPLGTKYIIGNAGTLFSIEARANFAYATSVKKFDLFTFVKTNMTEDNVAPAPLAIKETPVTAHALRMSVPRMIARDAIRDAFSKDYSLLRKPARYEPTRPTYQIVAPARFDIGDILYAHAKFYEWRESVMRNDGMYVSTWERRDPAKSAPVEVACVHCYAHQMHTWNLHEIVFQSRFVPEPGCIFVVENPDAGTTYFKAHKSDPHLQPGFYFTWGRALEPRRDVDVRNVGPEWPIDRDPNPDIDVTIMRTCVCGHHKYEHKEDPIAAHRRWEIDELPALLAKKASKT